MGSRGDAGLEQFDGAGVDLRGRHDAAQPAGRMSQRLVDQRQRFLEALQAELLVPIIVQDMIVALLPRCRGIARCQKYAQAAFRGEVEPTVIDWRQIGDRCDAAE